MLDWLRRIRQTKPKERKGVRKRRGTAVKQSEGKEFIQAGRSILKQKLETPEGTKELYFQPVKLEVPNMVTIGSKLDEIMSRLDTKPDKEWFETDYINVLKDIVVLAEGSGRRTGKGPGTARKPKSDKGETKKLKMIKNLAAPKLITHALEKNRNVTINELSEATGLSRVTLWKHLKQMKQQGVIAIARKGKTKEVSLI